MVIIFFFQFTGEIQTKGVCAPLTAEIYHPILQRLKKEGLSAIEEKEML